MKPPAFQFYAAEYLADEHVQLMTLEEEGAYIRLLSFCWREGSIPKEISALSSLCKGASTTVLATVLRRFKPSNSGERLIHSRLETERLKQQEWREKSAQGGKASAHKRRQSKRLDGIQGGATKAQPPATTKAQPAPFNTSSASSSSSASSKEDKKEHSAFAGMMKFLSLKIGPIPNGPKEGKAINWLIENGYDSVQCEACYEFLAAQSWRTAVVTWTTVKAEIGGWLAKSKPNENGHRKVGTYVPNDSKDVCLRCFNTGVEKVAGKGSRPCDHKVALELV